MPLHPAPTGVLRQALLCQNPEKCRRVLMKVHFSGPGGAAEAQCPDCGGISVFENLPDGVHTTWMGIPDGPRAPSRKAASI